jgi:DNA mismatch endonuclease (patch repair protein)
MADRITKTQRSKNMSAVRSSGNRSTELEFLQLLKKNKITGWRRHYKKMNGTPDFVFLKCKTAIFIDGCFWHGCPKCGSYPKSNRKFWKTKIDNNRKRDRRDSREVKRKGWAVLRIWEHEMNKRPERVLNKLLIFLINN